MHVVTGAEGGWVCSECGPLLDEALTEHASMTSNEQQPEPMSVMIESAVAMHEMFLSWLAAGFTEDQALKMLVYSMKQFGSDES